jgi:hypothetical protein
MDRQDRRRRATPSRPSMPGRRFIIVPVLITTATTGPAITGQATMALTGATGGHIGNGLNAGCLLTITQAAFAISDNDDAEREADQGFLAISLVSSIVPCLLRNKAPRRMLAVSQIKRTFHVC